MIPNNVFWFNERRKNSLGRCSSYKLSHNNTASKHIKQKLTELQGRVNKLTNIVVIGGLEEHNIKWIKYNQI